MKIGSLCIFVTGNKSKHVADKNREFEVAILEDGVSHRFGISFSFWDQGFWPLFKHMKSIVCLKICFF